MSFQHATRGLPRVSHEWIILMLALLLLLFSLLIANRVDQPIERTVPQPVLAGSAMLTR